MKKTKENLKGGENVPKNLEENQLNSRRNRKRGPERVFKETKLINGGEAPDYKMCRGWNRAQYKTN